MNPLPTAGADRRAHKIQADLVVVIAPDRQHRREVPKPRHQFAECAQLRAAVHKVAAQQDDVRPAARHGIEHLIAQPAGTAVPQMDVADVEQPACIRPRRQ